MRLLAALPGVEIDVVDPPGSGVRWDELERDRVRREEPGQVRQQQSDARRGLPRRVRRDLAAVGDAQVAGVSDGDTSPGSRPETRPACASGAVKANNASEQTETRKTDRRDATDPPLFDLVQAPVPKLVLSVSGSPARASPFRGASIPLASDFRSPPSSKARARTILRSWRLRRHKRRPEPVSLSTSMRRSR